MLNVRSTLFLMFRSWNSTVLVYLSARGTFPLREKLRPVLVSTPLSLLWSMLRWASLRPNMDALQSRQLIALSMLGTVEAPWYARENEHHGNSCNSATSGVIYGSQLTDVFQNWSGMPVVARTHVYWSLRGCCEGIQPRKRKQSCGRFEHISMAPLSQTQQQKR